MPTNINNKTGHPFASESLQLVVLESPKWGSITIFPQSANATRGGQTILRRLHITESLSSPIVHGSIYLLDVGNLSDNLNLEGFECISITFIPHVASNIAPEKVVKFDGTITACSLLSDDAVTVPSMNSLEKYRVIKLDFMNSDLFTATYVTPLKVPKNLWGLKDYVGWIADDGSRGNNTGTSVTAVGTAVGQFNTGTSLVNIM